MSNVLYEARPSLVRMKPVGTAATLLLMLVGIAAAIGHAQLAQMFGIPDQKQVIGLTAIVVFALATIRLGTWWITTRMDHLKITDAEIIWTRGIFNKQYTEVSMNSVRSARISQTLLQRLLNAGDLKVFTAGDTEEVYVRGLPNPMAIREYIKGQTRE